MGEESGSNSRYMKLRMMTASWPLSSSLIHASPTYLPNAGEPVYLPSTYYWLFYVLYEVFPTCTVMLALVLFRRPQSSIHHCLGIRASLRTERLFTSRSGGKRGRHVRQRVHICSAGDSDRAWTVKGHHAGKAWMCPWLIILGGALAWELLT